MERTEIPLSKKKIVWGVLGAIMFVVLGTWMIADLADSQDRYNPVLMKAVGSASVIFFGIVAVYGIRKLKDKKWGLLLDEEGVHDNSHASTVGLIPWREIMSFRVEKIMSTRFIMVFVTRPETYIENAKGLQKRSLQANMKMYGTPLAINPNTLQCKAEALNILLNEKLKEATAAQQIKSSL
ncbi:MAG: STM3941 family protein [Ferruginibacter sp.]